MFHLLDKELQKDLLAFCEEEEAKKTLLPLKTTLTVELLRQIAHGEREITGFLTNEETGDVFVRFSFTEEGGN